MHREDLMNPDLLSKIVLLGSAASKEQTAVGRIVPLAPIENKFTNADVGRVFKIAQC